MRDLHAVRPCGKEIFAVAGAFEGPKGRGHSGQPPDRVFLHNSGYFLDADGLESRNVTAMSSSVSTDWPASRVSL
jgi:hypothetical protein